MKEINEDKISQDLRKLTEKLAKLGLPTGYGLGGEYGYGTYYENESFGMHPYCWCESQECAWCLTCSCPDEAYTYFNNLGEIVTLEVYFDSLTEGYSYKKNKLLSCALCKGESKPAPNFWHKDSGSYIYWYKYIGRGMEISLNTDWEKIYRDVCNSIPALLNDPSRDRSLEINPPTL